MPTANEIILSGNKMKDDELLDLIKQHAHFEVKYITDMKKTVQKIEEIIETNGLKCRVTSVSKKALNLAILPVFFTPMAGVAVVTGLYTGIHTLATWNPDYELSKNHFDNSLSVRYQK